MSKNISFITKCGKKFEKDQKYKSLGLSQNLLLIQTNAHSVFCLGQSMPFNWDTSPKLIDRESLGESRTGARQKKTYEVQCRMNVDFAYSGL